MMGMRIRNTRLEVAAVLLSLLPLFPRATADMMHLHYVRIPARKPQSVCSHCMPVPNTGTAVVWLLVATGQQTP